MGGRKAGGTDGMTICRTTWTQAAGKVLPDVWRETEQTDYRKELPDVILINVSDESFFRRI